MLILGLIFWNFKNWKNFDGKAGVLGLVAAASFAVFFSIFSSIEIKKQLANYTASSDKSSTLIKKLEKAEQKQQFPLYKAKLTMQWQGIK